MATRKRASSEDPDEPVDKKPNILPGESGEFDGDIDILGGANDMSICQICNNAIDLGLDEAETHTNALQHAATHSVLKFEKTCSRCPFVGKSKDLIALHIKQKHGDDGKVLMNIQSQHENSLKELLPTCFPLLAQLWDTVTGDEEDLDVGMDNFDEEQAYNLIPSLLATETIVENCQKCNRRQSVVRNMGQHVWTHMGTKRFYCEKGCGFGCYQMTRAGHKCESFGGKWSKKVIDTITEQMIDNFMALVGECYPQNAENVRNYMERNLLSSMENPVPLANYKLQKPSSSQPVIARTAPKPAAMGPKCMKCGVAKPGILQSKNLVDHAMTHIDFRPFRCSICGLGTRISANLVKHFRAQHNGEGAVVDVSTKEFYEEVKIMAQEIYPGYEDDIERYMAKYLNADFAARKAQSESLPTGNMGMNLDDADEAEMLSQAAEDVDKLFKADGDSRDVKHCGGCDKAIAYSGGKRFRNLIEHAASHIAIRPFSCSVCGMSLRLKRNVHKHVNNSHNGRGEIIDATTKEYYTDLKNMAAVLFPDEAHYIQQYVPKKWLESNQPEVPSFSGEKDEPTQKDNTQTDDDIFQKCSMCNKKLNIGRCYRRMAWHGNTHVHQRAFGCSLCSHGMRTKTQVSSHLSRQHNGKGHLIDLRNQEYYESVKSMTLSCFPQKKALLVPYLDRMIEEALQGVGIGMDGAEGSNSPEIDGTDTDDGYFVKTPTMTLDVIQNCFQDQKFPSSISDESDCFRQGVFRATSSLCRDVKIKQEKDEEPHSFSILAEPILLSTPVQLDLRNGQNHQMTDSGFDEVAILHARLIERDKQIEDLMAQLVDNKQLQEEVRKKKRHIDELQTTVAQLREKQKDLYGIIGESTTENKLLEAENKRLKAQLQK
ncbi:unnamed protein product, partial [Mesorhabditis spiculigera]